MTPQFTSTLNHGVGSWSTFGMLQNNELSIPMAIGLGFTPSPHSVGNRLNADWFLSPKSWEVSHCTPPDQDPPKVVVEASLLKTFINSVQDWLKVWVETGSNPFIHANLYHCQFPACVQVAFTTLLSYINKTESNADIILRIVQERADELLAINGIALDNMNLEDGFNALEPLSVLDHVARVHALLVYQAICLFDGDIRSRHIAEGRVEILYSWATQMLECASRNLSQSGSAHGSVDWPKLSTTDPFRLQNGPEQSWHCWILAETVRRTWATATALCFVYFTLQQGYSNCPGDITFTHRQGVWEAKSAAAWEKLCAERDVKFVQKSEAESLFLDANPADIDEFGKMMLNLAFGIERVQDWISYK
jgi:hypothetical protein